MKHNKFVELLFGNWPAKVLSILAALIIAAFWRVSRLEERQLSVPVSVISNPGFVPTVSLPSTVLLSLRGESGDIYSLVENDFRATINLSDVSEPGEFQFRVKVEKRGKAVNIDTLQLVSEPAEIYIVMDYKKQKTVPIMPSFRGIVKSGYEILSYSLEPQRVSISGPASIIDKISDITTDYIELTERFENFSSKVQLLKQSQMIEIFETDTVQFQALIGPIIYSRVFESIPVSFKGLKSNLSVSGKIPEGTVVLIGPQNLLDEFVPGKDFLLVELSDIVSPGKYTKSVRVAVPAGLSAETWTPLTVVVEIK